jgi:hypothetical protein
LEEGEQPPLKVINFNEIPSLDTTLVNPTPMVEENQTLAMEDMNIDMLVETQEQKN